jgi:pimeloyl-ACP methyl ester carboxylesterase
MTLKTFRMYLSLLALLAISFVNCTDVLGETPRSGGLIETDRIVEEKFVLINGIEQWVSIKGNSSKPVILFLHGGPGSPLSPYADAVYGAWEKDFILVQWDQRGSGRTYGRNAPPELTPEFLHANPLTVEQIAADGIALAEYLIKRLGKQKVFLLGTSWGSVPGIMMASNRPGLFAAYIGHAQIVNPTVNFVETYKRILSKADLANDSTSLAVLKSIGAPPYAAARDAGKLHRIIKKYEQLASTPAPAEWFNISASYSNENDAQHRSDGDDYSFVNYVGDTRLQVAPMASTINFIKDQLRFEIPIYLIQGEKDILTPKEVTKEYFDKLKAPKKDYILVPTAAHGFNSDVIETQYQLLMRISGK